MWSFILAAVGIYGLYLAGKKNKYGWLIGFFAQFLWVIFAIATAQYGFLITAFAYGWVYGKNFKSWGSKEKENV